MKKITFCFFTIMNLCMLHSSAQTFQNIIGATNRHETGECVAQSVDGSMLLGGSLNDNGKNYPLFLLLNADGTVKKAATIGGLGDIISEDFNIAAVHTANNKPNGYIFTQNYAYDIVIIRIDNSGTVTWSKRLYAYNDQPVRILPIYSQATNNLTGFYMLAQHFSDEFTLMQFSASGDIVWQKKISHPVNSGGYFARNILPTNDGGCMVVGTRIESNNRNSSVAKFASGGALQWSKTYDFSTSPYEDIFAIAPTTGGYILSGSSGLYNLTFKIDALGNLLWANQYDNLDTESSPKNIIVDDNGNIVFTGTYYYYLITPRTAYIVKLNSSGDVIFGRIYDLIDQMNDLTLTGTGYFAIGSTRPSESNESRDVYTLKTDFSGNVGGTCPGSAITVNKIPPDFTTVKDANLKITLDTFKIFSITITPNFINNFEQDWCGASTPIANKTAQQPALLPAGSFKAYTNISAKEVEVLYNINYITKNAKYEVILYGNNGMVITKKPLQPNTLVHISMAAQLPGIYMAVLLKEGKVIARQNVVWSR